MVGEKYFTHIISITNSTIGLLLLNILYITAYCKAEPTRSYDIYYCK